MRTANYPSDLTAEQGALIEPHIPVYLGGRPRKTNLRDVIDAVLYVLRTGCQGRYLPKDFLPKSTVWRCFDEWRSNGTLDFIHDVLRTKAHTQEKPYAPRTTASIDRQSVDTTTGGEQTDVRVVGSVSSLEQGPRKNGVVVGSIHQVGDDSFDAQPTVSQKY